MRYKFRGKRLDGEWVYGYYAESDEYGDNGGCEHNYRETITTLYYIVDRNGKPELVLPESVGQWTGLVDKNGMEIYEGDIIRFTRKTGPIYRRTISSDVCAAKWIDEKSSFRLCYRTQRQKFSSHCSNKYDIIGNEFDSPELMEVE